MVFLYNIELGVRNNLKRNRNMSSEVGGSHYLQLNYHDGWMEEMASELDSKYITCNTKTVRAEQCKQRR